MEEITVTDQKQFPAWIVNESLPTEVMQCEEHCPPLLLAEREFTDGLNKGHFDKAGSSFIARNLRNEALGEISHRKALAAHCAGAVIIDGQIRCGYGRSR